MVMLDAPARADSTAIARAAPCAEMTMFALAGSVMVFSDCTKPCPSVFSP